MKMIKVYTILIFAILLLNACNSEVTIECNQIQFKDIEALIYKNITEDYNVLEDTLNDDIYVISIVQNSPSKTVLEKYVFDTNRTLTSYYFFNDFEKSNPILLIAKIKNSCLDSITFEGKAMSYRIYKMDSSEVFYVRAASPIFLKSILNINKKGDVEGQLTDTIKLNKNTWSYGLKNKYAKSIEYKFNTAYYLNRKKIFNDTLILSLPN